jgi:hypothetical protein
MFDVHVLIFDWTLLPGRLYFIYFYQFFYLVTLIIFAYSYKEGVDLRIIIIPMILITTKQEIRFLNLEDIDPNQPIFRDLLDKETFIMLITVTVATCCLIIG